MGKNDDDDELFDLFMFEELEREQNGSSGGGCLSCVLLMILVPAAIVSGIISLI